MTNNYQNLRERFKEIKKGLFEESKLKFPSVHSLQRAAEKLESVLKSSEIKDEDFAFWSSWRVRDIDIYIADLPGELEHDYEKRNQRYGGKWRMQERKLLEMLFDFETKFHEKLNEVE